MGFVVKNTTKWGLLDIVCPHTCMGCGQLGAVLCGCCKKNIMQKRSGVCPICKCSVAETAEKVGNIGSIKQGYSCKHPECESVFEEIWTYGWREGVVKDLISKYKYQSMRAAGAELVEIFDEILPKDLVGPEIVVVPLPTIGKHVRERGLDHTQWMARKLAKRRGWKCRRMLERAADTVQVGAKMGEREQQAKKAYRVVGKVQKECRYILLDDVWTTGATMISAGQILREAGAEHLNAVVLAVSKPKTASEEAVGADVTGVAGAAED